MGLLIHATISPGESNDHVGVYLREKDLDELVKSNELLGLPVRVEHGASDVGTVISAWRNGTQLDAVLKLNNDSIESMLISIELRSAWKVPRVKSGIRSGNGDVSERTVERGEEEGSRSQSR